MSTLRKLRSRLSKIKFLLGKTPIIEIPKDFKQFIPKPFKSVLLISADFELAWATRYSKSSNNSLQNTLSKARIERENIPKIINLCENFNIPITWLTVGHLFLNSCEKYNGLSHNHLPRITNFENEFWHFSGKDWFEYDPCSNVYDAPEWYCPDLIKQIIDSKVNHEIGCHTFSHIDCSDRFCVPDVIRAELQECKKQANEWGLELKSFVHPGHTIGNLNIIAEAGFTNYRTDYSNLLGFPQKHTSGLWELKQTSEFGFKNDWSIDYHIYRYITIIKRAIKSNTVCVFWFHPSFNTIVLEKIWPEVFRFIDENREDICVTTHTNYVNWMEDKWKQ